MPFWRKGNRPARLPGSRRSRIGRTPHFGQRALWALGLLTMIATAETVAHPVRGEARQKPTPKTTATKKANELTLAGLRPGRDSVARAAQFNRQFRDGKERQADQSVWVDGCRGLKLTIDSGKEKSIEVIRVGFYSGPNRDCAEQVPSPWRTGKGLRPGDPSASVIQLYGEPDSRSPSTKDGQPLELWYYAFDWAGPDVPQVMEVVCTREKDGQVGRVVEITLAAPSL